MVPILYFCKYNLFLAQYESLSFNRIIADELHHVTLVLHNAICSTDSFVFTQGHCVNFKAIRYEPVSFNRIVADKLHHVTLALHDAICLTNSLVLL